MQNKDNRENRNQKLFFEEIHKIDVPIDRMIKKKEDTNY